MRLTASFCSDYADEYANFIDNPEDVTLIISEQLDPAERVDLSRAYRSLREQFSGNESIETISAKPAGSQQEVADKRLSLSIA